ncbi:MAG TPA: 16S rRNA pseudouridine(516) synthase, partial [Xanthomonadaceae bacterium]|nr:16S rRNA pseudouridine(516) synthase [Xanthomonadaceae bacterium]
IVSPKAKLAKVYEATLAQDLHGDEAAVFASGNLLLEAEQTPLAPAHLETVDARHARLTLTEGRYHQVRRMFAAVGNHVVALHRSRVGGLALDGLEEGRWRRLDLPDIASLFGGDA